VTAKKKLRLVLADDTPASLQMFISALGTIHEIVAESGDGLSALQAIREHKPDVAVLDLDMPGLNGIQVTRESRKDCPNSAVVICSVHADRQLIQASEDAGALGYVIKSDGFHDLAAAVRAVARGQRYFPPDE
jgi:DNA-binding NarL/FixJ family response regulator